MVDPFAEPPQAPAYVTDPAFSGAGDRHPVVFASACILLADAVVAAAWHGQFPHENTCTRQDCGFWEYERWRNRRRAQADVIIRWRRYVRLGASPRLINDADQKMYQRLAAGVPLEQCAFDVLGKPIDPQELWFGLRELANGMGIDPGEVLEDTRRYLAQVLGLLAHGKAAGEWVAQTPAPAGVFVRDAVVEAVRFDGKNLHALQRFLSRHGVRQVLVNSSGEPVIRLPRGRALVAEIGDWVVISRGGPEVWPDEMFTTAHRRHMLARRRVGRG